MFIRQVRFSCLGRISNYFSKRWFCKSILIIVVSFEILTHIHSTGSFVHGHLSFHYFLNLALYATECHHSLIIIVEGTDFINFQ